MRKQGLLSPPGMGLGSEERLIAGRMGRKVGGKICVIRWKWGQRRGEGYNRKSGAEMG